MAHKTHKIALRPNKEQASWFQSQSGYARFAFNNALSDFKAGLETDEQSVRVEGKRIKLPKIGWVRMFQALRFEGKIIRVTISRRAHRWFVSIAVDTGTPNNPRDTRGLPVVGIDVGINSLATLDNGKQYPNPRPLKRYERKLKREQRSLSRKEFLSNNWYKQKRKIERLHYRISCIREDAQHKATTEIINAASAIGIEALKITNMLKNRNIAKALSDSAFGGFLAKLKSKADALGIHVEEAPEFFASSKTCSNCGHKKTELSCPYQNAYIVAKYVGIKQIET